MQVPCEDGGEDVNKGENHEFLKEISIILHYFQGKNKGKPGGGRIFTQQYHATVKAMQICAMQYFSTDIQDLLLFSFKIKQNHK